MRIHMDTDDEYGAGEGTYYYWLDIESVVRCGLTASILTDREVTFSLEGTLDASGNTREVLIYVELNPRLFTTYKEPDGSFLTMLYGFRELEMFLHLRLKVVIQ